MEMPRSRTFGGLLAELAERYADRPAVVFEGSSWTFRELDRRASALAKGLLALGLRRGDHLALLASNRPEWLWVAFAAMRIGAVLCPLNTWYKRAELDYILNHCDAKVLFTMERFLRQDYVADWYALIPELAEAKDGRVRAARYPCLERVVFFGGTAQPGALAFDEVLERGRAVGDAALAAAAAEVRPEDVCYLLYTSGSTAAPKGALLQHVGCIENAFQIGERQHLTPDDRLWLVTPLFWGLGSENALPAIYGHGGCIVLQEHFEPGHALELIERERCTVFYGLGNITRALLDHPDFGKRDVSSLENGVVGFTPEDKRLTIGMLGVARCCSIYGLTECYGNSFVTDANDPLEVKLYTQGFPLPNTQVKIVDPETGRRLGPGEIGLLCLKGYTTLGYYKNPEETAKAYDAEGYFIPGDLGQIDQDGRFRFHARAKEMIKTGGINVSPLEVELLLLAHPKVKQAFVVGVPDEERGERVAVFVEPADPSLTAAEVRAHVKEQAASYKVPDYVFFRSDAELPRLASGKVPKYVLREMAIEEVQARSAPTR